MSSAPLTSSPAARTARNRRTRPARHSPEETRHISQVVVVLAGLEFPAHRWEIVMFAERYGADRHTRLRVAGLPEGSYRDLTAVTDALARRVAEGAS